MDINSLTNYLEHVYNLESELYGLTQLYNKLQWKKERMEIAQYEQLHQNANNPFEIDRAFQLIGCAIGLSVAIWFFTIVNANTFSAMSFGTFAIMNIVFLIFFLGTYIVWCNSKQKEWQRNIDSKNEEINKRNINTQNYRNQCINFYIQEMNDINNTYIQVHQTLNSYYDLNIIFPKYRSLIPISSFYEYLQSGRCTELTGTNGTYNKYEDELRQNLIISKLDTIISQLENIKSNQFMLYQAINNQTQAINNLDNNVQSALDGMDNIQATQNIQAYNQAVLARNSQELVAYKRWSEVRK